MEGFLTVEDGPRRWSEMQLSQFADSMSLSQSAIIGWGVGFLRRAGR